MLKLEPVAIPDGFRWRTKLGHLTYAAHIPHEQLITHATMITCVPLVGFSVVHETSPDGHQHTHFGWMYKSALDLVGARKFDIYFCGAVIHPHMQPKLSATAMESLFNEYHMGRKYDVVTGKKAYTKPTAGPWQKLPPEFEWAREVMRDVVTAPTLQEAVVLAGVRPRSVMDVKLLRTEMEHAPKQFKHLFPRSSFLPPLFPVTWNVLHVCGPTGIGKTKFACAQFANPLYVKPFNAIGSLEKLKKFNPTVHDGIVFDEVDLRAFSRELVIGLTDFDEESTLTVRYNVVEIPAGVRKIFISNLPDIWPASDASIGALARRVTHYRASSKLY